MKNPFKGIEFSTGIMVFLIVFLLMLFLFDIIFNNALDRIDFTELLKLISSAFTDS